MLSKPRVAIVFEYATLNGGERSMLAALDELKDSPFEFVAVAPDEDPLAESLHLRGLRHVPFCCRDANGTRIPRELLLPKLLTTLRSLGPAIVHANSLSMGRLIGAISDELDVPTVSHLRDILKLSAATIAELNQNTLLLAVSQATRDFHVAQGLDAERTRVVYNGVDCGLFRPEPKVPGVRRTMQIPDDAFIALTVGQIGPRKGLDILLDAALRVQAERPDVYFVLVGTRNSSKEESVNFERALFMRIGAEHLADRIRVMGDVPDVERLMRNSDLLVHAARQEPLGRVLLEAAACGLPIVATDVGGTSEILDDGLSARLVPAGDATSLANAIIEMRDNPQQRVSFGKAARHRAVEKFSISEAAWNLESVWREFL
ncbi:MAG: glycosyltransferase family 4 protein [Planctomycetaceae bacterium]